MERRRHPRSDDTTDRCAGGFVFVGPAATIAGFAASPLSPAAYPDIESAFAHLRKVLGDQAYESLARTGEAMTTSAIATYAYDQIDQARTELEHPS